MRNLTIEPEYSVLNRTIEDEPEDASRDNGLNWALGTMSCSYVSAIWK